MWLTPLVEKPKIVIQAGLSGGVWMALLYGYDSLTNQAGQGRHGEPIYWCGNLGKYYILCFYSIPGSPNLHMMDTYD